MQMKGDMPKASALTTADRFVYFYMTIVTSSVFFPDKDTMTENTKFYMQMGYSGVFLLPFLYILMKACAQQSKLGNNSPPPQVKMSDKDKGPDASWIYPA